MSERVLICGSRTWDDIDRMAKVIERLPRGTVVIHGANKTWDKQAKCWIGADCIADRLARENGLTVEPFAADWNSQGRAAGPIRNRRMLVDGQPDRVIAFRCNGVSRGTDDMVKQARAFGVPVEVIES